MSNSCNATWEDMGFAPEERAHWTALGLLDAVAVRDLTSVYQRYTNDEIRRLAEGEPVKQPIVIVVRDPDCSNEYHIFDGPVETYDVDCGYLDLRDRFEFLDWAESHLECANAFEAEGRDEAATFIRNVVMQYAESGPPDADIQEADSTQLLAIAKGVREDPS